MALSQPAFMNFMVSKHSSAFEKDCVGVMVYALIQLYSMVGDFG